MLVEVHQAFGQRLNRAAVAPLGLLAATLALRSQRFQTLVVGSVLENSGGSRRLQGGLVEVHQARDPRQNPADQRPDRAAVAALGMVVANLAPRFRGLQTLRRRVLGGS